MRLITCLAAIVLHASVLLAQDAAYVVRLDPAAAADGADAIASRLAATYGGTVLETAGDAFVLRIPASRARLVAKDPNVASVVAAAHDVSADAVTETVNWTAGVPYAYDGSGNITQIGNDRFAYDSVGRLIRANMNNVAQSYEYDAPGNRKRCTQPEGDCQLGISISSANNRIENATYDGSGNLQRLPAGTRTWSYDALNMQTRDVAGSAREFLYTADDERLAVYSEAGNSWRWTLRAADGKVLRELASSGAAGTSNWQWIKDYVWREGTLLASRQPEASSLTPTTYHYHADHLGTPRRVTDARDRVVGVHDYHAFGSELPGGTDEPSATAMKFTGHERDEGGLDYMHARYYDPQRARFLSVDPVLDIEQAVRTPQIWNRYAYVLNNPLMFDDPTGEFLRFLFGKGATQENLEQFLNDNLHGVDANIAADGNVTLTPNGETGPATPEQQGFADVLSAAITREDFTVEMTVVAGDSGVTIGQYITGTVDLGDVKAGASIGPASQASLFAHEVSEQTAKTLFQLPGNRPGFEIAHPFGVGAQTLVSGGWAPGSQNVAMSSAGTGTVTTQHTRNGKAVTVTLQFKNGNLVKVNRK
jgi:RHS repeat-associated protein